jgi:cytochrome P450
MIDLLSPGTLANLYPLCNELREKQPVCQIKPGTWLISRHEDVTQGLKNYKLFTSEHKTDLFSPTWLNPKCRTNFFLSNEDPPEYHTRRQAISPPFVSGMLRKLAPFMDSESYSLSNKISHLKNFEFLRDYAYPYFGRITGIITGLDSLQELSETHNWIRAVEQAVVPNPNNEQANQIESTILKQRELFEEVIIDRRKNHRGDFISELVHSQINGTPLSTIQLVDIIELLIRAGFQSTVHSLTISVVELIRDPKLQEILLQDPESISPFVDEFLRLHSSVPFAIRHTTREVVLHNTTIPEGDTVFFCLASANRDPRIFSNPDVYDLKRTTTKENIAFGYGPHICLGLHLAKMELTSALRHLAPLIPTMSCPQSDEIKWLNTSLFRAIEELPISIK